MIAGRHGTELAREHLMRASPSQGDERAPLQERWAMALVHGQACWACGADTTLREAEIVPIVPLALAGDGEALRAHKLEPDFDVAGPRNRALACIACARTEAPLASVRENLDRAARRAVMVRRAALEAAFAPGLVAALAAFGSRPADELTADDVAALAVSWASFQARKTAHVRGADDAYDFVRDSFAKTTIWWKPPPPLRLAREVALVFEDMLAERLASLRWSLLRA